MSEDDTLTMLVYQRVGAWPKAPGKLSGAFGGTPFSGAPGTGADYYDMRCSFNGVLAGKVGTAGGADWNIESTYYVNWGKSTYVVAGAMQMLGAASAVTALIAAIL